MGEVFEPSIQKKPNPLKWKYPTAGMSSVEVLSGIELKVKFDLKRCNDLLKNRYQLNFSVKKDERVLGFKSVDAARLFLYHLMQVYTMQRHLEIDLKGETREG